MTVSMQYLMVTDATRLFDRILGTSAIPRQANIWVILINYRDCKGFIPMGTERKDDWTHTVSCDRSLAFDGNNCTVHFRLHYFPETLSYSTYFLFVDPIGEREEEGRGAHGVN